MKTKYMAKLAILIAVEFVFQIIGNFITIGGIAINLSLIPIGLAAMMLGPLGGFILGLANGILVIFAPSTFAVFMPINVFGTILVCLAKSGLAGLLAGFVFKIFKKKNLTLVGAIIIGVLIPLVNTGLFVAGCFTFFYSFLVSAANGSTDVANIWSTLIFAIIGVSFIFEISSSVIITPILSQIKPLFRE